MGSGFAEMLLRVSCGVQAQEFPGGQWAQGAAHALWDAPGSGAPPQPSWAGALQAAQTRDTMAHLPPLSELNIPLQEC